MKQLRHNVISSLHLQSKSIQSCQYSTHLSALSRPALKTSMIDSATIKWQLLNPRVLNPTNMHDRCGDLRSSIYTSNRHCMLTPYALLLLPNTCARIIRARKATSSASVRHELSSYRYGGRCRLAPQSIPIMAEHSTAVEPATYGYPSTTEEHSSLLARGSATQASFERGITEAEFPLQMHQADLRALRIVTISRSMAFGIHAQMARNSAALSDTRYWGADLERQFGVHWLHWRRGLRCPLHVQLHH